MKYVAELMFYFYLTGRFSKESLNLYLLKYIQSTLLKINVKFYGKNNNKTHGSEFSSRNKIMDQTYTEEDRSL